MARNNDVLPNLDLSESKNKMTDSNLEDDTEDFIQPSQPPSLQSPEAESTRKRIPADNDSGEMSISTIDETLNFPKLMISTPFGEESRDFIPESENPVKRKMEILDMEECCKKRLNLDLSSVIKETPDMFSTQSQLNDTVDAAKLKVPPSQSNDELENVSLVPESPPRINETLESQHSDTMFYGSDKRGVLEETTAEDSFNVETGDLSAYESSKNEISNFWEQKREDRTGGNVGDKIIIDSSSKFIDDSGMTSLLRSGNGSGVEEGNRNVASEETQLDDTIDAEDIKCYTPYSNERSDTEAMNGNTIPPVPEVLTTLVERASESVSTPIDIKPETSRLKGVLKNISEEELARLQKHSTPENPLSKSPKINESASSIENGTPPVDDGVMKSSEINFTLYLQLDCQLIMDPNKEEPISKKIINVKELLKRQPKHLLLEPSSDSSYKTKTLSSSSSGSVYSDKTGLPYPLPNRSLPMSVNSSSSSVDLAKHVQIVGRQVWINEYKIPMAMDDIIPRYVEHHKLGLTFNNGKPTAKRKMSLRVKKKSHWSHPLDNVLESSMTEQSSGNNSDDPLPRLDKPETPKSNSPKDVVYNSPDQEPKKAEEKEDGEEMVMRIENIVEKGGALSPAENESAEGIMSEGLLVFARWTDKRYYPGKLEGKAKYGRWDVKFDDDTEKVVREDLILPLNWLTKGELVFALAADKYMSGKIAEIIREKDIQFKIELDDTNEEIVVNKCDICLNDVMATIIREKYQPTNKAVPLLKSCDIDVDNVLTGKRVREQRTPIRGTTSALQSEGSTMKKRKGGLRLSEDGTGDKQTPVKKQTPPTKRELQTERKTRCSSRKKGKKGSSPSNDARPEAEDIPSPIEKTPVQLDQKSDGRKKRARALKYDSEKCESSNKKSRKSETVTTEEAQTPAIQRVTAKTANRQTECALDIVENAENAKEASTSKKSSKGQKVKGEKSGGKVSVRPNRSKPSTGSQDLKKKKKSS